MKGFIGSANIDTNSRLCMASSVAGHRRAFGSDTVPGCYEDLELADLVVLVGSNLAWCHPVLYQRIAAAKEARPEMKVVLIDPRRTMTADIADLHLPIKRRRRRCAVHSACSLSGASTVASTARYIGAHTTGFAEALRRAGRLDLARHRRGRPGIAPTTLARVLSRCSPRRRRSSPSTARASTSRRAGTDKVNAIINCHLATGRIGKPGMGPFSVTGQPNAMGGREVGGLANMLAAHMEIEDAAHRDRVQRFWRSPDHRRASRA